MTDHTFYFIVKFEISSSNLRKLFEFVSAHRHSVVVGVSYTTGEDESGWIDIDDLQNVLDDVKRNGMFSFSLYIVKNKEDVLNLMRTGKFSEVSNDYLDKNILDIDLDIICNGDIQLGTFYSLEYEPLHLLDKLIEFVTDLYYFLKPLAVIHCAGENYCWALEDLKCFDYKTLKKEGKPKIIGSFNIFSPEIVKNIGRDKFFMLKRIVYKVEELKDGGILLQINRNPVKRDDDKMLLVMEKLGLDTSIYDEAFTMM